MAKQTRSAGRRQRAQHLRRAHPIVPAPLARSRSSLGTTAQIMPDGERFLAEHPELHQQSLSPYNPARWIGTDGATTRGYLALAESSGWLRRGMIVLLVIMLVGAVVGVAQMVGAIGARNGTWGQNFLFGLLGCGLFGTLTLALAWRLLRPAARR